MARDKNLSTLVKDEKVRVQMVPGRICVRPKGRRTVELNTGGFAEVNEDAIAFETEGEYRMGMYTRFYDENDPSDVAALSLLRAMLQEKPWLATHVDFQIKIVGEFDEGEPWPGYDDQDADQVKLYWSAMPDRQKAMIALEDVMKHELARVDENGETITDKAKVDMLNKLYREQVTKEADAAETGVAL